MKEHDVTAGEIMEFLQEHMVTKGDMADLRTELKGDMADLRTELKGDMAALKSDVLTSLDGFAKWHQTFDAELAANRSRCERVEGRVDMIESKSLPPTVIGGRVGLK